MSFENSSLTTSTHHFALWEDLHAALEDGAGERALDHDLADLLERRHGAAHVASNEDVRELAIGADGADDVEVAGDGVGEVVAVDVEFGEDARDGDGRADEVAANIH